MARTRTAGSRLARLRDLARLVAGSAREHNLLTYASAISFRSLVALVPLVLLGLALLPVLGLEDVWYETLAPAIEGRVTLPVFGAVDSTVQRIFESGTAGLVTFASALVVWDMVWAVGAVMSALNRIHDVEERRSFPRVLAVRVALAVAVILGLIGAVLVLAVAPVVSGGALDVLLGMGRWVVAVTLLGLAVGLLMRYAPAERPDVAWASAGSVFVIASWVVASLGFKVYVTSVANFETAAGSLTVFLVLTSYVLTSAAIFLVGAELDELLRRDTDTDESVGVVQLLRAAFGR